MNILDKDINHIKRSVNLLRELADLYYDTFNERMKLGCGTCYVSAYNKLKLKFKVLENSEKKTSKFVLSVSHIREFNSSEIYTNDNLTDEVAVAYIKKNKNRLKQFKKYPSNIEDLLSGKKQEVKEEVKEVVAEVKKATPKKRGRKPKKA